MNYYERFMGDYGKKTGRLSLMQHGAYALLLDAYYSEEEPLPSDYDALFRICRAMDKVERDAVKVVADKFFPVSADGLRHNDRADEEIAKAHKRIAASRENGKKGGRKAKPNPKDNPPGSCRDTQQGTCSGVHHTPYPSKPISEQPTTTTKPLLTDATDSSSPPSPYRCADLAMLLSRFESGRFGKDYAVRSDHPMIAAWVEAGITNAQFESAYSLAVAARVKAGDSSPVNPGFLDAFVAKVMNGPASVSSVKLSAVPWYDCKSGIDAKGVELGMKPYCIDDYPGGYPQFKALVFKAAGHNLAEVASC